MTLGLPNVLTAIWQSGNIPHDRGRGMVFHTKKGIKNTKDCNDYRGIIVLSVTGKVLLQLLSMSSRNHPAEI